MVEATILMSPTDVYEVMYDLHLSMYISGSSWLGSSFPNSWIVNTFKCGSCVLTGQEAIISRYSNTSKKSACHFYTKEVFQVSQNLCCSFAIVYLVTRLLPLLLE